MRRTFSPSLRRRRAKCQTKVPIPPEGVMPGNSGVTMTTFTAESLLLPYLLFVLICISHPLVNLRSLESPEPTHPIHWQVLGSNLAIDRFVAHLKVGGTPRYRLHGSFYILSTNRNAVYKSNWENCSHIGSRKARRKAAILTRGRDISSVMAGVVRNRHIGHINGQGVAARRIVVHVAPQSLASTRTGRLTPV